MSEKVIETLESKGMLGDIRQRLGAKDAYDNSKDVFIVQMSARKLTAVYYGWELGDDGWGYNIIDCYERLKKELSE